MEKVLSLIKILFLKVRYGSKLELSSLKQYIRSSTEIKIIGNGEIKIGKLRAQRNVSIVSVNGLLEIGERVFLNRNCIVACRERIFIGDNCSFGPNVCIYDHDHAFTKVGIIPNEFKTSEVIIEEGCWIGAGSIILRGTHIGANTVIGAGTIVKGNIPPNSLVTSNQKNIIKLIE